MQDLKFGVFPNGMGNQEIFEMFYLDEFCDITCPDCGWAVKLDPDQDEYHCEECSIMFLSPLLIEFISREETN